MESKVQSPRPEVQSPKSKVQSPRNPEGCQTVAGGRSEAQTPGKAVRINCTLEGCQKPLLVTQRHARAATKGRLPVQRHQDLDQLEGFWHPSGVQLLLM